MGTKKVVCTDEASGLEALMGEEVTIWCACYIYHGTLTEVGETTVKLEDASVVYETGPLTEQGFKDAQKLPSDWYIQVAQIESFGVMG